VVQRDRLGGLVREYERAAWVSSSLCIPQAPSSYAARVRHSSPSRAESPRTCQRVDWRSGRAATDGAVRGRQRIGAILSYYYRSAA